MSKALAALAFLALNFYIYQFFATAEVIPTHLSFANWPLQIEGWSCPEKGKMDDKTLANLGASDYLICDYRRADPPAAVDLYVGWHETQIRHEGGGDYENSIHPPKHCLPGSGWEIIDATQVPLDLEGLPQRPALVNRLVIAKGEQRALVYYWYQTQGRVVADDWRKIVYLSWDRARRHRTDGSLIRLTTSLDHKDDQRAEADLRELAALVVARLGPYVPN
ncbi:MAG TPA: EpsI family protein [Myxococcota bacterium]|nr:EpsI family protein [Myxococcota bacterium]